MNNGNLPVFIISGQLADFKEQFQVHHVIDDDRILPAALRLPTTINIPGLDASDIRIKSRDKRIAGINQNIFILLFASQSQSISK